MPCLITTRAAIENKTRQNNNKKGKNENFTAKTQYLKLKAPSNNVQLQSDKTLTTQIYFFLTTQHMGFLKPIGPIIG